MNSNRKVCFFSSKLYAIRNGISWAEKSSIFSINSNLSWHINRSRMRTEQKRWVILCHRSSQSLQGQRKPLHREEFLKLKFLNWFQAQFIDAIEKGLVAHFKVLGSDLPVPVSFLKCAQDRLPFRLQDIGLRYLL
jgi:hypothetical protein